MIHYSCKITWIFSISICSYPVKLHELFRFPFVLLLILIRFALVIVKMSYRFWFSGWLVLKVWLAMNITFYIFLMQIFESDRFNEHDHYHALAFIIGMFLSSIPYLLITSLLSSAIGYFLIGLHRGAGHFSYLFLDLLTSLLVSESCMKNVAIIVGNSYMGMVIGSCIQVRASLVYIL